MSNAGNSTDINQRIENALEAIRPYLKTDGGDVKVVEVTEDMIVKIELQGACVSCPMSTMTLKAGVEKSILDSVPEVKAVEAVNIIVEG